MKKIILRLLCCLFATAIKAQTPCVPGTLSKPQSGYILPDSATNFNHACVGLYYEQIIYIKAPKDTTLGPVPATVDSFVVNKNVIGLPPGLVVEAVPGFKSPNPPNPNTNFERLIIKGDSLACIRISGTVPVGTTPSVYNLTIEVRAYLKISGIVSLDTASNIGYYKIDVKGQPCWPAAVNNLDAYGFELNANAPNPFSGVTLLSFNANQPDQYRLKVVNLLGEEVYQTSVKGLSGMNYIRLDASQWSSGVYIYALSNGRNTLTGKLQVIQ
jgi:hypothetical protein